jgi:folate-dependent phosphoribosylglycinamide formyltransferase PurN
LITTYPQLKGKDPQIRAYNENYGVIGSVVHKVTPEVDDGDVLTYTEIYRQHEDTLDDIFEKLAFTSFKSWQKFFDSLK